MWFPSGSAANDAQPFHRGDVQHLASPAVARPSCQTLGRLCRKASRQNSTVPGSRTMRRALCSRSSVHRAQINKLSKHLGPKYERALLEMNMFRRTRNHLSSFAATFLSAAPIARRRSRSSYPVRREGGKVKFSTGLQACSMQGIRFFERSPAPVCLGTLSALPCYAGQSVSSACMSNQRPNPSIEGTCNIRLRRLSPAPHVKR